MRKACVWKVAVVPDAVESSAIRPPALPGKWCCTRQKVEEPPQQVARGLMAPALKPRYLSGDEKLSSQGSGECWKKELAHPS